MQLNKKVVKEVYGAIVNVYKFAREIAVVAVLFQLLVALPDFAWNEKFMRFINTQYLIQLQNTPTKSSDHPNKWIENGDEANP